MLIRNVVGSVNNVAVEGGGEWHRNFTRQSAAWRMFSLRVLSPASDIGFSGLCLYPVLNFIIWLHFPVPNTLKLSRQTFLCALFVRSAKSGHQCLFVDTRSILETTGRISVKFDVDSVRQTTSVWIRTRPNSYFAWIWNRTFLVF